MCDSSKKNWPKQHIFTGVNVGTNFFISKDGFMRKINKLKLDKKLEMWAETLNSSKTDIESFIVDGMVVAQELQESSFSSLMIWQNCS